MAYHPLRLDRISFCVYWGEVREKLIILCLTIFHTTSEIHELDIEAAVLVLSAATDLFTQHGIFVLCQKLVFSYFSTFQLDIM